MSGTAGASEAGGVNETGLWVERDEREGWRHSLGRGGRALRSAGVGALLRGGRRGGRRGRQLGADGGEVGAGFGAGAELAGDAGDAAQHGRVVAIAEEPADFRNRLVAVLTQDIHGQVARVGDVATAALA